jgi:hypothetical protein
MLLSALTAVIAVLTALDHWTTYVCLRASVPGWEVTEANPLAAWLFDSVGLGTGLVIDTAVTAAAVLFVHRTRVLPSPVKSLCLLLLVATTGYAVANNLEAVSLLGILSGGTY